MNDPARQERIKAAVQTAHIVARGPGDLRTMMGAAFKAADAIEPRPVYLTADERKALADAGTAFLVDPTLKLECPELALEDALNALDAAQEAA